MAYVAHFICDVCGEDREEVQLHGHHTCRACRQAIAKAEEDAYIAKQTLKPLDKRIEEIELMLHRLNVDTNGVFKPPQQYRRKCAGPGITPETAKCCANEDGRHSVLATGDNKPYNGVRFWRCPQCLTKHKALITLKHAK